MKKRESKFCTELQKWFHYIFTETCVIEAKVSVDDKPFNYKSGFKPHQLPTLVNIKNGSFQYKISDADRTIKPFDIMSLRHVNAYVAIMWIRKGNKTFYLISPEDILEEISRGSKSLTEERAKHLAAHIGTLK